MDFTQRRERFLSASVQFLEKKLFAQKNFKSGLDRHDKLWYSVVTARLVKSNQGCETLCKGFRFLLAGCGILVCSAPPARQRRLWYSDLCENRKQKTGRTA